MTTRILIAEDDRRQAELLRRYLEREGYSVMVDLLLGLDLG